MARYPNLNNLGYTFSTKESGYYTSLESLSNITVYPEMDNGKGGYRIYVDIEALPSGAGTLTIAHGISFNRTIRIGGTADDTTSGTSLPLPYASSTAADIIEMYVNQTNIYIIVGKDLSMYAARVYLDYIK